MQRISLLFYTKDYFSLYYYLFSPLFEQRLFFTFRSSFISRNILMQCIRILKTDRNSSGESIQTCPWIKSLYMYMYKNTSFPHFRGPKTETIKDSTSIPPRFSYWSAEFLSSPRKRERKGDKEERRETISRAGKLKINNRRKM